MHRGERVALLGPNGAGKTTLVLHLNGILTPGAGTVTVSGLPVADDALLEIRRRVGIVFQDPDDQLFMPTVRDDVAFGPANLGLRGAELDARVAEALDLVGVGDLADRAPHHLSFGQRRRVAIATVLAMRPEILVLDEPSSNLDPASRRELAAILRSLDVTVLMVTHDLPYAVELCERSVVLSEGTVVADGPTRVVLGDADLMARHRLELPGRVLDLGCPAWLPPSSTRPSASSPAPSDRPAAAPSSSRPAVGAPGVGLPREGAGERARRPGQRPARRARRGQRPPSRPAEVTPTRSRRRSRTSSASTPLALAWDSGRGVLVIECHDQDPEEADEDSVQTLRVVLSPQAAPRAFARRCGAVVSAGRPSCPFCGQPLDPTGHICPRANGYRR